MSSFPILLHPAVIDCVRLSGIPSGQPRVLSPLGHKNTLSQPLAALEEDHNEAKETTSRTQGAGTKEAGTRERRARQRLLLS